MSLFAALRCWWKAILNRSRTDHDVKEEFQFYIDSYAADLIRQGMEPAEAQRQARIALGRAETQNEKYRAAIGLRAFDELGTDIRYGLRSLFKNLGYASVAILSLALGIGATTAMFSLIYAVLIHPFPYADSDRIMNPVLINEERPQEVRWFATIASQFQVLRHAKSIEDLLGFASANTELTGSNFSEDVTAVYLTENADTFFGVPALLGRGIQPSDAQTRQPVAVLNYRFWQRHFQGDPSVIGRTLQLDHVNYTIAGVMPRRFTFNDTISIGDVYLPRNLLHDTVNPPTMWPFIPWIKLKPGVSPAEANAELEAIVRQFAKELPQRYPRKFHMQLQPIIAPYSQNTGRMLALLLISVALLLAIGCANCSILMLARGSVRQHELALRQAIGASRWRIIRQLLIESLVIAFSGAVFGVAASYWLARLPVQLAPDSFPPESLVRINLPVLGFSLALAVGAGVLFGLFPALRLSRTNMSQMMQSGLRRIPGSRKNNKFNPLITGQIALTLLLMTAAGTATAGFLRLTRVPLGYDPQHVMQIGIMTHWKDARTWAGIKAWPDRVAYFEQIRQKIASVPGVISVAAGTFSAPPDSGVEQKFELESKTANSELLARLHRISPEYFSTLRIPLLAGRIWNQTENTRGDSVAIVNESFARRYLAEGNAIGQQVRMPDLKALTPLVAASSNSAGWRQIIGIVGDARNDGIDRPVLPAIYVPYTTMMEPFAQFDIRTQGEPLAYLHSIRQAVQSVSSDQQVSNGTYDLKDAIERDSQWTRQRLFSVLFGCFSALALLLALAGLFSVVSYSVAQKTAEFGVRMALGASRSHILWIATQVAVRSVMVGIADGLTIDLLTHKLLTRWMNNSDLGSHALALAALLLAACSIIACLLPARRAASIHPVEALRYE